MQQSLSNSSHRLSGPKTSFQRVRQLSLKKTFRPNTHPPSFPRLRRMSCLQESDKYLPQENLKRILKATASVQLSSSTFTGLSICCSDGKAFKDGIVCNRFRTSFSLTKHIQNVPKRNQSKAFYS